MKIDDVFSVCNTYHDTCEGCPFKKKDDDGIIGCMFAEYPDQWDIEAIKQVAREVV